MLIVQPFHMFRVKSCVFLHVCSCVYVVPVTDAVIWDMNYGVGRHPWDISPNAKDCEEFFKGLHACTSGTSMLAIIWHAPEQHDMVKKALVEADFLDPHTFYWYKHNQNVEGHHQYTYAVEQCMLAYKGGRTKMEWLTDKNPLRRHNMIVGPSLSSYALGTDSKALNLYQKPGYLSRILLANHLTPGMQVLVVGFGSGGDILGAVANSCNVKAVELNPTQFNGGVARLSALAGLHDEAIEKAAHDPDAMDDVEFDTIAPCCAMPNINVLDLLQDKRDLSDVTARCEGLIEQVAEQRARAELAELQLAEVEALADEQAASATESQADSTLPGSQEVLTGSQAAPSLEPLPEEGAGAAADAEVQEQEDDAE
jgi:hypothetical protein